MTDIQNKFHRKLIETLVKHHVDLESVVIDDILAVFDHEMKNREHAIGLIKQYNTMLKKDLEELKQKAA